MEAPPAITAMRVWRSGMSRSSKIVSDVGNSALADRRQVVGLDRSPHDHGRRHLADLVDGPDLNDWFVRADPDRLPTIAPAEIELK